MDVQCPSANIVRAKSFRGHTSHCLEAAASKVLEDTNAPCKDIWRGPPWYNLVPLPAKNFSFSSSASESQRLQQAEAAANLLRAASLSKSYPNLIVATGVLPRSQPLMTLAGAIC